jgi:protein SCO1/2
MMGRGQKIFATVLWAVTVMLMLVLVGAGLWVKRQVSASGDAAQTHLLDAPEFALVDQSGAPISRQSLLGKVWVADFIFTNCAGPCPKMTAMMSELQTRVARPDLKLVSFTVDPERDTPEVLKMYGDRFGADHSRWHFLTGTAEEMSDVARGMSIAAVKNDDSSISHGTYFILVDRGGRVRGYYRQSDPTELDRLAADAAAIADEPTPEHSR